MSGLMPSAADSTRERKTHNFKNENDTKTIQWGKKKYCVQHMVLEKLDNLHAKNEVRFLSYTIHKKLIQSE